MFTLKIIGEKFQSAFPYISAIQEFRRHLLFSSTPLCDCTGWKRRHSLGCRIKFISAGALHEYREHICHAIQPQLLSRELSSVCLGQIVFLFIYFAVKACILIILMEISTQGCSGSQKVVQNLIACIFNSFNVFI